VLPRLVELARSSSPGTRLLAARALGWSGQTEALATLKSLLADGNTHVVEAAARALGELGRPEAASALEPLLSQEADGVRAAAIEGLVTLDIPGYEEPFASMLERHPQDEAVLVRILKYLSHHGDAECVARIGHIVSDTDRTSQTRLEAARTLRDIALEKGARARLKVLDILGPLIEDARLTSFVEAIAHLLDDLEDDRGVEKVVAPETRILKQNPRHFYSRYARAKKYYRFRRYAEAIADCREGLRWGRKEKGAGELRVLMAACYAGLGNFKTARRVLHEGGLTNLRDLPAAYPEFKAMAQDKRYASLFGR
jgi:tetratricopeptide (TPR) repeat protein